MAENDMQEKTEEATPKKREKAREEGDVAKSVEIPSVFVLLGGIIALYMSGGFMYKKGVALMHACFVFKQIPEFTIKHALDLLYHHSLTSFLIFLPLMLTVFIMAIFANISMVGFVVSWKAISIKWEKLDPINGLKKKLSLSSIVELIKSIAKLTVIGLLAWFAVRSEFRQIYQLHTYSIGAILLFMVKTIFKIFIWVILPMAAVAILDYAYQKWQFEQKLKMTKQEVKDEYKQTEGDPQVKSRIKSLQFEAAKKRMMAEVPNADVVITNPTHLSVAIRYDKMSMAAPKVVAKGAGLVALKIREIAEKAGVPMKENKLLARNLYKTVDVGDEIPEQTYLAIAEILAYVYKQRGRTPS